jgi:predicted Rossmann fold nucleotide-binding protein DprA/Smf involved in DNA uptake
MSTQHKPPSRGEVLKQLRTKHADAVEHTQKLLKEQKKLQQELLAALREKPRTIPELAAATGLASERVLWFVAALKKYGLVAENGMSGDYPLYQKVEEEQDERAR